MQLIKRQKQIGEQSRSQAQQRAQIGGLIPVSPEMSRRIESDNVNLRTPYTKCVRGGPYVLILHALEKNEVIVGFYGVTDHGS